MTFLVELLFKISVTFAIVYIFRENCILARILNMKQ